MSMTAALRDRLVGAAIAGPRVYRDKRVQADGLPAFVLQLISDPRPSTMDGRQALRESRVQIDALATSRTEADVIAERAIETLEVAGTFGGIKFSRSFVDAVRTDSDTPGTPSPATIFRTSLDLLVWHQPAA